MGYGRSMELPSRASDQVPPVIASTVPAAPRGRRGGWWLNLVLIGGYPLLVGVLGWARAGGEQPALGRGVRGLLLVCGIELLVFGTVFGLAWLASRASWDDLLLRLRPRYWAVPLGIAYSVLLRLGLGLILAIFGVLLVALQIVKPDDLQNFYQNNRPDVETLVDVDVLRGDPLYFWLTVTLVSFVVAGLREELWRCGLLASLRKLWPRVFGGIKGQFLAVAVAAVIFGLGHAPQGMMAVGLTAFLGVGLGAIMVLHRSIWPAVIAHGMFDATTFALLPWALEQIRRLS